jgi:amicyanin
MKRIGITLAVIIVVVIGGLLILNTTNKTKTADDSKARQTDQPAAGETGASAVILQDLAFSPTSVTVKKGTTVTWTNHDSVKHDVESDTDSPAGGLDSPLLAKGEQFSFTFDTAGTYKYHCNPHPFMKATVTVTE